MTEKLKTLLRKKMFWILFALIVISVLIQIFVGKVFQVQGDSMEGTLHNGTTILIEKVSYYMHEPKRNDIIVVSTTSEDKKEQYIKRIIGLPGETVQIRKGKVFINDEKLKEQQQFPAIEDGGIAREPIVLGEDEYFLLGDNRNHSKDSRNVELGVVHKSQIEGKACFVVFPFGDFGLID